MFICSKKKVIHPFFNVTSVTHYFFVFFVFLQVLLRSYMLAFTYVSLVTWARQRERQMVAFAYFCPPRSNVLMTLSKMRCSIFCTSAVATRLKRTCSKSKDLIKLALES